MTDARGTITEVSNLQVPRNADDLSGHVVGSNQHRMEQFLFRLQDLAASVSHLPQPVEENAARLGKAVAEHDLGLAKLVAFKRRFQTATKIDAIGAAMKNAGMVLAPAAAVGFVGTLAVGAAPLVTAGVLVGGFAASAAGIWSGLGLQKAVGGYVERKTKAVESERKAMARRSGAAEAR